MVKVVSVVLTLSEVMKAINLTLLFGAICIVFAVSSYTPPAHKVKRPADVWVVRSVLDKRPRMLTIALDSECYIAYDLTKCTVYKAWKGGLSLDGAPYTDKKEIQPTSWGTPYTVDTSQTHHWQASLRGKSVLPPVVHRGYTLHQNRITLHYALILPTNDTVTIHETPEFVRSKTGKPGLERLFTTANVPAGVELRLQTGMGAFLLKNNQRTVLTTYFNPLPAQTVPTSTDVNTHPGRVLIDQSDCFTCHKIDENEVGPAFRAVAERYPNNNTSAVYLNQKIKKGGSGVWGNSQMNAHPNFTDAELTAMVSYIFTLKPKTTPPTAPPKPIAEPDHPKSPGFGAPLEGVHPSYTLATLHTKQFKPRVGGMAFLPNGRLLVTTWDKVGGVYLLDGVTTGDTSKIRVKRIASGLAEPLGIEVVDGQIYVLQKQELTRLVDLNGDDVIDDYQVVCNGWSVSADFHEFAFGLVYKGGYFYATLSMAMRLKPGEKQLPDRGKTIKIAKNGTFEAVNMGLRTPNGIGVGIDNEIFLTDNQGQWLPANKLIHVKKGEYHGMNWGWLSDAPAPDMALPAIWLPEDEIANSPSEPVLIHDGPYKGQLLHGDVTYGGINRDFLEKINGDYQGAVFRFSQGFEAGVNRMRWGPDGALYIGEVGMAGGGWSWKERLSGLQRLAYNGKPTFDMLAVRAKARGFEIEFTQPLSQNIQLQPADVWMQQWRYLPTKNYGGPKIDLERLTITKLAVSEDRKRVYVETPDMKPRHVVYIRLPETLRSQNGQHLWSGETWYTLNNIPK